MGFSGARPSIDETDRALNELNTFIETRLQFCDLSIPIQWVAATVTRIALARSWFIAHLSVIGTGELNADLWQLRRENLFLTAIEVVEFSQLLESSEQTAHSDV